MKPKNSKTLDLYTSLSINVPIEFHTDSPLFSPVVRAKKAA